MSGRATALPVTADVKVEDAEAENASECDGALSSPGSNAYGQL